MKFVLEAGGLILLSSTEEQNTVHDVYRRTELVLDWEGSKTHGDVSYLQWLFLTRNGSAEPEKDGAPSVSFRWKPAQVLYRCHAAPGMVDLPVIQHVVIRSTNMKASEKFYDKVLLFLGFEKIGSDRSYAAYGSGRFSFWVLGAGSKFRKDRFLRQRVGFDHMALAAESRHQVDQMENLLRKEKFKILYPAEEHLEYSPGYYSVSFYDPDGIIIELVYLP